MDGKKQVTVYELREGMTIAADLYTGNGAKLLPSNTRLSLAHIGRIISYHHFDPIVNTIYIFDRSG